MSNSPPPVGAPRVGYSNLPEAQEKDQLETMCGCKFKKRTFRGVDYWVRSVDSEEAPDDKSSNSEKKGTKNKVDQHG